MKKLVSLLALALFSLQGFTQDSLECMVNANFIYSIDGDYINFTNASTDEMPDPLYHWSISPLTSTDENPVFLISDLDDPTYACLTVHNAEWTCYDSICMTISFVEDSVIIIDSTDCTLAANFTYSMDGDYIYFTNTSTDEPIGANYDWWVTPLSSLDENPSFLIADLDDPTTACLTVYNDDWSCYDSICMIIYMDDDSGMVDSTDCTLAANFTYSVDGDYIYFTNTSTDEPIGANYDWWVTPLSSSDENPSFLIADLDDPTTACLTVYNDDWSCYDSICMIVYMDDDSGMVDSTAFIYSAPHSSFNLYPNPASNELILTFENDGEGREIQIYNSIGVLVRLEKVGINQTIIRLEISELPAGSYYVHVTDTSNQMEFNHQKFIKF